MLIRFILNTAINYLFTTSIRAPRQPDFRSASSLAQLIYIYIYCIRFAESANLPIHSSLTKHLHVWGPLRLLPIKFPEPRQVGRGLWTTRSHWTTSPTLDATITVVCPRLIRLGLETTAASHDPAFALHSSLSSLGAVGSLATNLLLAERGLTSAFSFVHRQTSFNFPRQVLVDWTSRTVFFLSFFLFFFFFSFPFLIPW